MTIQSHSRCTLARSILAPTVLALSALLLTGGCGGGSGSQAPATVITVAKLLIEHNGTDEDTGFQGFADGDPWNELRLVGPTGLELVHAQARGGLLGFGLTEFFFETSEPANADVPIADVLALLLVGNHSMSGQMVEGGTSSATTPFTRTIPTGPLLTAPPDGSGGLDPNAVVLAWDPVTEDLDGDPVQIVGYQVIVEEDAPPQFPQGFYRPVLSVYLPASATSLAVPAGFLVDDACYQWEVLAIEVSGNQTLSSAEFEAGAGCLPPPPDGGGGPQISKAKILIEHNATDEDTGFQGFADGDPWNELIITGPGGTEVVSVSPRGALIGFGLTELFFETSEPANADVPIPAVLARLPAGTYTFAGDMVDGPPSQLTATLTHVIPAGPELLSPIDGATGVNPASTVVSWTPVTTDLDGNPITIVGYQVIVEEDAPAAFPQGFARPQFSIYLPASATSVQVPGQFMRPATSYKYEVLAIEVSGNQTLSSAAFSTQ